MSRETVHAPIHVKIRLFGSLRAHSAGATLAFELKAGTRVVELMRELAERYPEAKELAVSALADESRVLKDDETLRDGSTLAVLPPVCGG